MSTVLLAGLSDQEAVATGIMVGKAWQDMRCIVLRRSPDLAIPKQTEAARECGHCVIDLTGIGLRRYTPEHAEHLADFLQGRSAVLIIREHDAQGWTSHPFELNHDQIIVWLAAPYSSEDLRAALGKVRSAQNPHTRKDEAPQPPFIRTPPARTSFLRPDADTPEPPKPAQSSFLHPGQESAAPTPTRPSLLRPGTEVPASTSKTPVFSPQPAKPAQATRPSLLRPGTVVPASTSTPEAPHPPRHSSLPPDVNQESVPVFKPTTSRQPSKSPAPPPPPAQPHEAPKPERPSGPASAAFISAVMDKTLEPSSPLRAVRAAAAAPPPTTAPSKSTVSTEPAVGLLSGAFPILMNAFPELAEHEFFRLIEQVIKIKGPVLMNSRETRAGVTAFIIDIRQGWMASKIPAEILMRVADTPSLLKCVHASPITPQYLDGELRQRFGNDYARIQRPLDQVSWVLGENVLKQHPPTLRNDFRFRLQRMPNFTALGRVDTFEIQMAALCSRTPHSVLELRHVFPYKEPAQIDRFAILSILSGAGVILPQASASRNRPGTPKPEQNVRRGFFKSLLDKLF